MPIDREWRDFDWSSAPFPERKSDYIRYRVLQTFSGVMVAKIENFRLYPTAYYARVGVARSGPLASESAAMKWCEEQLT